ncbi:MAG TPA: hypothetical protein DC057_14505 [Spirochaetia bacterium]|nr:hypothetical protein [Spirochaetia bacterium]
MGTRGVYGFYKDNVDKLTYNHSDSYPSWLGKEIVNFVKSTSIEELNQIFDKIILVDEDDEPTAEQIKDCEEFTNLGVSNQSIYDWYCLLREAQGNLSAYKSDLRYMIDGKDFIKDSLFCEWGYVINLTSNILEIYKGCQRKRNSKNNRYRDDTPHVTQPYFSTDFSGKTKKISKKEFYSCEIIQTFPLDNIPDNWLEIL